MTRCVAGDTAFFRKGVPENLSKFVTVLSPCNPGLARMLLWRDSGAWWLIESNMPIIHPCGHIHGKTMGGKFRDFVPDDHLTPLRYRPGQDETLTWQPKRTTLRLPPPTNRKPVVELAT